MDLTVGLVKKTFVNGQSWWANASMHQQSTRWRHGTIKTHAVWVETSVNSSAKRLHITILEMDTPLGSTQTGSISEMWHTETYNSPFNRTTRNNLHSVPVKECFQKAIPQTPAFTWQIAKWNNEQSKFLVNKTLAYYYWFAKFAKVFHHQGFLPYSSRAINSNN